jgi:hypothetical protein
MESTRDPVPANLQRATLRLKFPPSYVIVGVYRLCTDRSLYKPAWDKCKHGVRRGLIVGFVWVRPGIQFAWHLVCLTRSQDLSDIQDPKTHHTGSPQQPFFSLFSQLHHSP